MQVIAGVDVHKKMLAVVVRREQDGQMVYEKRKFGTNRKDIEGHLGAWLQHFGVSTVVMESTAQYWRPVWHGLEELGFELHLCNPLQVRAPRGKKRDYLDAQRLANRWAAGDLEDSFVPGKEQREWRAMTRARVHMKRKIGVNRCQVEGLLEQGSIKLTSVVSDVFGASGWAMLKLIAKGETDAEVLVKEARGSLRQKESKLKEALAGKLDGSYRLLLKQHMEQVELLRKQVEEVNEALAKGMHAYLPVLVRLSKMPGVDLYAAQELIAEIGPKAAAFQSADKFAGWAGICPGSKESAGVNYSRRSAKGNRYLRRLLSQIAWAAIRTKDSYFAGLFARMKPRLEGRKAAWAVAHRVGRLIWLLLHEEVEYKEMGSPKDSVQSLERKYRRLLKAFARHGIDPRTMSSESTGNIQFPTTQPAGAHA